MVFRTLALLFLFSVPTAWGASGPSAMIEPEARHRHSSATGPYDLGLVEHRCDVYDPSVPLLAASSKQFVAGQLLFYRQEPEVVLTSYTGDVTLREFTVAGDLRSIEVGVGSPFLQFPQSQVFDRVALDSVGGQLVSVFEPVVPSTTWRVVNRLGARTAVATFEDPVEGRLTLRVLTATSDLPNVKVKTSKGVQYTSHVANIVLPDMDDFWAAESFGFVPVGPITNAFLAAFSDSYESLSLIPDAYYTGLSGAAQHRSLQNSVEGIGLSKEDLSPFWGSSGALQSVDLFSVGTFNNEVHNHELAHTWASFMNWKKIGKIKDVGHQPMFHYPLLAPESVEVPRLLDTYLHAREKLSSSSNAGRRAKYEIAFAPPPNRLHPITLYAMGHLAPEDVPELFVFKKQGQKLDIGKSLIGKAKKVDVGDIVKQHGPRSGPVFSEWNAATVLVSRKPVSKLLLRYYTHLARRREDPQQTGVIDFFGVGSFEQATDGNVDLRTGIRPLKGRSLKAKFKVDLPFFEKGDVLGLELDSKFPSRVRASAGVPISGRVVGNSVGASSLTVEFRGRTATEPEVDFTFSVPISSDGIFDAVLDLPEAAAVPWPYVVVLFTRPSGSTATGGALAPVIVEP